MQLICIVHYLLVLTSDSGVAGGNTVEAGVEVPVPVMKNINHLLGRCAVNVCSSLLTQYIHYISDWFLSNVSQYCTNVIQVLIWVNIIIKSSL